MATTHLTAIITAAGSGNRMGFDKMFAEIGGQPVIRHSIAAFEKTRQVNDIIIVAREDRVSLVSDLAREAGFKKVRQVVKGGERRQDSVACALSHVADHCEFISVHDGARPWITPKQIERVLQAAAASGAAASAHPVTDTLKRADTDLLVSEDISREGMWAMETPQVFRAEILKQAFARVIAENQQVSDEVSAVQKLGLPVQLVHNDTLNPKITFPADLRFPPPAH
ncbi:MAG: 2-C-methyl-D-erythritol 4-phosphate cytidylyltransferase [Verrucomicrobiales bacterium]|nr:2-C-methyl-D-erythritol 4-phosphate cytidylyltransferase [Verrucomicrobiales bacterium]